MGGKNLDLSGFVKGFQFVQKSLALDHPGQMTAQGVAGDQQALPARKRTEPEACEALERSLQNPAQSAEGHPVDAQARLAAAARVTKAAVAVGGKADGARRQTGIAFGAMLEMGNIPGDRQQSQLQQQAGLRRGPGEVEVIEKGLQQQENFGGTDS